MDYIMWSLIGIFTYLAIGYIFVCLADANEDAFWEQIKVMLFWPMLWIILIICCIVFAYIEIRNRIKRRNINRLKLWWKQLFCKHKWEYEYTTYSGIIKTCVKCGKVKS